MSPRHAVLKHPWSVQSVALCSSVEKDRLPIEIAIAVLGPPPVPIAVIGKVYRHGPLNQQQKCCKRSRKAVAVCPVGTWIPDPSRFIPIVLTSMNCGHVWRPCRGS